MPIIDLQGEADGSATVTSDTAYPWYLYLAGEASGLAALSGTPISILWASGAAYGLGDLTHLETVLSGLAAGSSAITGGIFLTQGLVGNIQGQANVYDSLPLPIYGKATLVGELELDSIPVHKHYKKLYLGQMLQKGDLELHIKALDGTPLSPYAVEYTLYHLLPPHGRVPVAGQVRVPAQGNMWHYYATGFLDGQPGMWQIGWYYQMEFDGPVQEVIEQFEVTEVRCHHELPWHHDWERCRKKGWD